MITSFKDKRLLHWALGHRIGIDLNQKQHSFTSILINPLTRHLLDWNNTDEHTRKEK